MEKIIFHQSAASLLRAGPPQIDLLINEAVNKGKALLLGGETVECFPGFDARTRRGRFLRFQHLRLYNCSEWKVI